MMHLQKLILITLAICLNLASWGIGLDTIPALPKDSSPIFINLYSGIREILNSSRYTPRIIYTKNKVYYNWNQTSIKTFHDIIKGELVTRISNPIHTFYSTYVYAYSGSQSMGHFIFDIDDNKWVSHISNFITFNDFPTGSVISADSLSTSKMIFDLKNVTLFLNQPKKQLNRSGYLTRVLQNRENKVNHLNQSVSYTEDSLNVHALFKESWFDFHIDKKGKTHAFVYINGELIYLQQNKASYNPDVNTWKEIFSVPATDDIGPFTSVTVKGKQYLFTQDGTILKNTGKTMIEVGKLPGDLRNTSVVWDKVKDKMWYITKEEFDAYKAGDAKILNQLNKIQVTGKAPK